MKCLQFSRADRDPIDHRALDRADRMAAEMQQRAIEENDREDEDDPIEREWRRAEYLADNKD